MATRAQKRTASDPIDGGAPDSPVKKATKNKDKSRTPEAQKEAMADALSEANMVAEEGANGDASSKDKGRPRTDLTELLESRKERDEARREAEDLKRRLQKLEEAKIRRELEAATSGKTSEKSFETNRYSHFFQFHTKHGSILTRFLAVKALRQSRQQEQQQEAEGGPSGPSEAAERRRRQRCRRPWCWDSHLHLSCRIYSQDCAYLDSGVHRANECMCSFKVTLRPCT